MKRTIPVALVFLFVALLHARVHAQTPAAVSPRDGQVRPGPRLEEFRPAVDKLRLDVATIVGIHGGAARAAAKK